ncbi:MAG: hypothetical protein ABIP53_05645, partial [Candidatus Limnocylindrales bacterium]
DCVERLLGSRHADVGHAVRVACSKDLGGERDTVPETEQIIEVRPDRAPATNKRAEGRRLERRGNREQPRRGIGIAGFPSVSE